MRLGVSDFLRETPKNRKSRLIVIAKDERIIKTRIALAALIVRPK